MSNGIRKGGLLGDGHKYKSWGDGGREYIGGTASKTDQGENTDADAGIERRVLRAVTEYEIDQVIWAYKHGGDFS